jgi:hypothetical protein
VESVACGGWGVGVLGCSGCALRVAWSCAWCVVRGAWCVVRGAWCVVCGAWCDACLELRWIPGNCEGSL